VRVKAGLRRTIPIAKPVLGREELEAVREPKWNLFNGIEDMLK